MPIIPVNPSTLLFDGGSFSPIGHPQLYGQDVLRNPKTKVRGAIVSARIVVGFKVGNRVRWRLQDLVTRVREKRIAQGAAPDATFVAQRGIYRHQDGKRTVEEPGAQVFIMNLSGQKKKTFEDDMEYLAESIAADFKQETVILEMQKNGVSQGVWFVTPR